MRHRACPTSSSCPTPDISTSRGVDPAASHLVARRGRTVLPRLAAPLFVLAAGRARGALAAMIVAMVAVAAPPSISIFSSTRRPRLFAAASGMGTGLGALLVFLPPLPGLSRRNRDLAGLALIASGFAVVSQATFQEHPRSIPASALHSSSGLRRNADRRRRARRARADWPDFLQPVSVALADLGLFPHLHQQRHPERGASDRLAVASILVATVPYRYIERPFRQPRWTAPRTVSVGLPALR